MLHKELIAEYRLDVSKLPDDLQYAIRETAALSEQVGASSAPVVGSVIPDTLPAILAPVFDSLYLPQKFNSQTLRQLLTGDTQRFFAKGTHNLFGPTAYVLWDSDKNYHVIKKEVWEWIMLPDIGEYKGNWESVEWNYNFMANDEQSTQAMLQQLDENIAGQIVLFLKANEARLEEFVLREDTLLSVYDITNEFKKVLGDAFYKEGKCINNIGRIVTKDSNKTVVIYVANQVNVSIVVEVEDEETIFLILKPEGNYLIPIKLKDKVGEDIAWTIETGYIQRKLSWVYDLAMSLFQELSKDEIVDFNTEIEKMKMELAENSNNNLDDEIELANLINTWEGIQVAKQNAEKEEGGKKSIHILGFVAKDGYKREVHLNDYYDSNDEVGMRTVNLSNIFYIKKHSSNDLDERNSATIVETFDQFKNEWLDIEKRFKK